MFQWLYKAIARGIISEIDLKTVFMDSLDTDTLDSLMEKVLDMAKTEEFQKDLAEILDPMYERYKSKVFSSIGGSMKGVSVDLDQIGGQTWNPTMLLGKGGKPNWMGLLMTYLNMSKGQQSKEAKSGLP